MATNVRRSSRERSKPVITYDVDALFKAENRRLSQGTTAGAATDEEDHDVQSDGEEEQEAEASGKAPKRRQSGGPKQAVQKRRKSGSGSEPATPESKKKPGRPRKQATASPATSTEAGEAEEEEVEEGGQDQEEDGGDQVATPPKRKRKGAPGGKGGKRQPKVSLEEDGSVLYEAVKRDTALAITASDWVSGFERNPNKAMEAALNLVLLTAGASRPQRTPQGTPVVDMSEEDYSQVLEAFIEDLETQKDSWWSPLELVKGKPALKRFRPNFRELWRRLVEASQKGSGYNMAALEGLGGMLTQLSSAGFASLRLTSTLAAMEMGQALVDGQREITKRLDVSRRQQDALAGKKGAAAAKAKALELQINQLETAHDEVGGLINQIFNGVFLHRYRDLQAGVRVAALEALGNWMAALPGVFMEDNYLKYLGWTLYDKDATVRLCSLQVLDKLCATEGLAAKLQNLMTRFHKRILQMASDVDGAVMIQAIKVTRAVLNAGLLEDLEDGAAEEVESAVFDRDTPLEARAQALAFHMDRLEVFDESDADVGDEERESLRVSGQLRALVHLVGDYSKALVGADEDSDASLPQLEEAAMAGAAQLVSALWILPQASLLQDWEAVLTVLSVDSGAKDQEGLDDLEQSILARLLSLSIERLEADLASEKGKRAGLKTTVKEARRRMEESLQGLTGSLLKMLPALLVKFQGDEAKLGMLTELPGHLVPHTLAVTKHKAPFKALLNQLTELFPRSSNDQVLGGVAKSLQRLLNDDHGRREEVESMAQSLLQGVSARVIQLCNKTVGGAGSPEQASPKDKRKGKAKQQSGKQARRDSEYSLGLALRQLRHLTSLLNLEAWGGAGGDTAQLAESIREAVRARCDLDQMAPEAQDPDSLALARTVVLEGTTCLCVLLLWPMDKVIRDVSHKEERGASKGQKGKKAAKGGAAEGAEDEDQDEAREDRMDVDEDDKEDNTPSGVEDETELLDRVDSLVEARNAMLDLLQALLGMHMRTVPPSQPDGEAEPSQPDLTPRDLTEPQMDYVSALQHHAYVLANQLRIAFKTSLNKYQYLEPLAWQPDNIFTGLLQMHFESQEATILEAASEDPPTDDEAETDDEAGEEGGAGAGSARSGRDRDAKICELLVPLTKSIVANFDVLNKRQAAAVVGHFVDGGRETAALVKKFTSELKGYNQVRYLEVQMATLRVYYDRWIKVPVPEDGQEEAQEDEDEAGFTQWLPLAKRLSLSLGVGQIKGRELQESFFRFMREGVRFSLDQAPLNLSFLEAVALYVNRLLPAQKKALHTYLQQCVDSFSDEVAEEAARWQAELEASPHAAEGESPEVPRRWKALFSFQHALGGPALAVGPGRMDTQPDAPEPAVPKGSRGPARQAQPPSADSAMDAAPTPGSPGSAVSNDDGPEEAPFQPHEASDEDGEASGGEDASQMPQQPARAGGAHRHVRLSRAYTKRRTSGTRSVRSDRSRLSAMSDLFPVEEMAEEDAQEDQQEEQEDEPGDDASEGAAEDQQSGSQGGQGPGGRAKDFYQSGRASMASTPIEQGRRRPKVVPTSASAASDAGASRALRETAAGVDVGDDLGPGVLLAPGEVDYSEAGSEDEDGADEGLFDDLRPTPSKRTRST